MRHFSRRLLGAAVLLCATAFAGCGDKSTGGGGGGVLGTWKMDISPMVDAQRGPMMDQLKAQFAEATAKMKDATPEQLVEIKKVALEQVPPDMKPLAEAFFVSEDAAKAVAEKMLAEKMSSIHGTLELKSGGVFSASMQMGPEKQDMSGEWKQDGDKITMTAKIKDGKPVTGEDAKSVVIQVKDGKLVSTDPGMPMSFVR